MFIFTLPNLDNLYSQFTAQALPLLKLNVSFLKFADSTGLLYLVFRIRCPNSRSDNDHDVRTFKYFLEDLRR